METVVIKRPSNDTASLIDTEYFVQGKTVCTAPPGYKCQYRRATPFSQTCMMTDSSTS